MIAVDYGNVGNISVYTTIYYAEVRQNVALKRHDADLFVTHANSRVLFNHISHQDVKY